MPLSLAGATLAGAGISGGSGIIASHFNRKLIRQTNQQNIDQANYEYARSRADAIADRDFANKYNSPEQQMLRFKEAGLNPNLIYGQAGNTQSAVVRSSDTSAPPRQAPQFDPHLGMDVVGTALRALSVITDTENTRALTELNRTRNQGELIGVDQRNLNLEKSKSTMPLEIENWRLRNESMRTNQHLMLSRNEREALASADNHKKALEELITIRLSRAKTREEITNLIHARSLMKNDNLVKEAELQLRKQGVHPTDPWYLRKFLQVLDKLKPQIPFH